MGQQLIGNTSTKTKVCIIGSGNWGSAIATIIGQNCLRHSNVFETNVNMWVYEELIGHEKLSHIINTKHVNVKYLPNILLPSNIIAVPNLPTACRDATLLIFVLPHQFLPKLLPVIRAALLHPSQCLGVSLIKGIDFDPKTKRPLLYSQMIEKALGPGFACGVLMGANVANEVAQQHVCESTLACQFQNNEKVKLLFDTPYFRIQHTTDVVGVEVCGAIKNCIAIGAGFVDGMKLGSNTKAALLRIGLKETYEFGQCFFPDQGIQYSTLMESCGMADLITTCYNGRNRKCAQVFAEERLYIENESNRALSKSLKDLSCQKLWEDIERRLLNGQKLQGISTLSDVYQVLQTHQLLHRFPLMKAIYEISFGHRPVHTITDGICDLTDDPTRPPQRSYL